MQKLKLDKRDIKALTGECDTNMNIAIKKGDLETFRVGRRLFALPEAVSKWIAFLKAESDKGRPVQYQKRPAEAASRPKKENRVRLRHAARPGMHHERVESVPKKK